VNTEQIFIDSIYFLKRINGQDEVSSVPRPPPNSICLRKSIVGSMLQTLNDRD
jgi:hypothetical protein